MSNSDVLNGLNLNDIQNSSLLESSNQSGAILAISLDNIKALPQVRSEFNDGFVVSELSTDKEDESESTSINSSLNALAESIKQRGLQNPIIVRKAHVDDDFSKPYIDDHYVIVSGERRFRAMNLLRNLQQKAKSEGTLDPSEKEITTIDCIVREYSNSSDVCLDQLTENIQRVDLDPFEIAHSLVVYQKSYKERFNKKVSREELAKRFGKTLFWVSQMMTFAELDPLNDADLIDLFKSGAISKSARTGYEVIRLYRKSPDFIIQSILDYKEKNKIVDRGVVAKLSQELNNYSDDSTSADVSSNINQPGLILSSTEYDDVNADDNDNSTDSDYSELSDKEETEYPKMFAKNQESSAPTAGVNATSSYSDRDTKVSHDLSDSIHDEDNSYSSDYNADDEISSNSQNDDMIEIESINCEYIDEQGPHKLLLKLKDYFTSNTEISITTEDNIDKVISVKDLKIISFNFK